MRRSLGLTFALLFGGWVTTAASTPPPSPSRDEVPMIAGRISAAEGDVQIWRTEEDGQGEWDAAQLNDVVTVSTALATGARSRVEVRVGPHALRLDGLSRGSFSQLDFAAKVFALAGGVANLRLASAAQDEVLAVTAGGVNIDLAAPGRYRVDAIEGEPLRITVFEGHGTARYGVNSIGIGTGQALVLTQSSISYATAVAFPLDDWALARDQRLRDAVATPYVSPDMTGYEDLATYGNWVGDSNYGTVWVPNTVPAGWAPYRYGRWRWVAPWGWSWVDAAPWGYAPFHYGRWVTVGGRWCWWPGAYVARPIWAPALVGFVGSGANVAVGIGAPVVGWYPLAPWHPYRPNYRANDRYVTVINQTIINRPPHGVPPTINHGPGATMVPGPRFRDPVNKVAIVNKPPVAELQPMAPPPRTVARTAAVGETPYVRGPHDRPSPPSRTGAGASPVAQGGSKFSLPPQPPLPGQDSTPLAQPPGIRGVETRPSAVAPAPRPDIPPPKPRAYLPQDQQPPGKARSGPAPAEPAVYPPGTLPTPATVATPGPNARPQPVAPPTRQAPRVAGPPTPQPAQIAPVQASPPPAPAAANVPAAAPQPATASPPSTQSKQEVMRQQGETQPNQGRASDVPRGRSMER